MSFSCHHSFFSSFHVTLSFLLLFFVNLICWNLWVTKKILTVRKMCFFFAVSFCDGFFSYRDESSRQCFSRRSALSHGRLFLTVRKSTAHFVLRKPPPLVWVPGPRFHAQTPSATWRCLRATSTSLHISTFYSSRPSVFFLFFNFAFPFSCQLIYILFSLLFFITLAFFVLFLFLSSLPVHFIFAFFLYLSLCIHITSRHGHGNLSRRQSSLSAYVCLRISFFLFLYCIRLAVYFFISAYPCVCSLFFISFCVYSLVCTWILLKCICMLDGMYFFCVYLYMYILSFKVYIHGCVLYK